MALYQSDLPFQKIAQGKVRDIYSTDQGLLLLSTDRLSAFDVVFADPIPAKGQVLNQLAAFWFHQTETIVRNHLIDPAPEGSLGLDAGGQRQAAGRCSLVQYAQPYPIECVVRGYLEGSAWADYQREGAVSGVRLPAGLQRREQLPMPIFTASTKAETGHDEPIGFDRVVALVGSEVAEQVRHLSLELYKRAHNQLMEKDITLSDTKFEFGADENGEVLLIDEALTPDSSRFWEAESYFPDSPRAESLDKQYVRDYVESIGWNKQPPAPKLPPEVIDGMTARYCQIFERITGSKVRLPR